MRIIGGTAARRNLKAPKGLAVRPTPDLVRQAVFNSLGNRVAEAMVLELFGGTGALSLESLSRGAKHAVCVELSRRHALGIRANFQALNLPDHTLSIWVKDVYSTVPALIAKNERYDLIFADPPYGEKNVNQRSRSDAQKLLDDAFLPELLKPEGLFVLGHAKRDQLQITHAWEEVKCLRHGDSIMRFLRRSQSRQPSSSETPLIHAVEPQQGRVNPGDVSTSE